MSLNKGRKSLKNTFSLGRHIVYCEGTKTEPNYINNIKDHIDKNLNIINRYDGIVINRFQRGYATIELLKKIEEDLNKRHNKGEQIDYVWIFFDKDSFNDFDDACTLITSKNNKEYKNFEGLCSDRYGTTWMNCWSNECFEVWVYFHFENLITALSREDYIPKINNFIKNRGFNTKYEKNIEDMFDFIINNGGDINKAVSIAKLKDNGCYINPSSGIYKFIEYFKNVI